MRPREIALSGLEFEKKEPCGTGNRIIRDNERFRKKEENPTVFLEKVKRKEL